MRKTLAILLTSLCILPSQVFAQQGNSAMVAQNHVSAVVTVSADVTSAIPSSSVSRRSRPLRDAIARQAARLTQSSLSAPSQAKEQDQPGGLVEIGFRLPTLYVVDRTGRETVGQLAGLTDRSLVLDVGAGRRTFEPEQVKRIQRRGDSLKTGAIVGAIVGGPIGLWVLGDCPPARIEPPPRPVFAERASCPGERTAIYLVYAAVSSAVGTTLDAAHTGRTDVWRASAVGADTGPFMQIAFALPTVYVLDDAGRETAGRLVGLTDASLELAVGAGRQRFERAAVRRVQVRGDSLRNGATKGAVVGALLGGAVGILLASDAPHGLAPAKRAGAFLLSTTLFTSLFSAVGTTLDAVHRGRTTVWEANRAARRTATLGVATEPSRVTATVAIRW